MRANQHQPFRNTALEKVCADRDEVMTQRNEVLKALRALYDATPDCIGGELGIACKQARSVIDKYEGGAYL